MQPQKQRSYGMREVYLAQDTKLDRNVALKTLPSDVAAVRSRMIRPSSIILGSPANQPTRPPSLFARQFIKFNSITDPGTRN